MRVVLHSSLLIVLACFAYACDWLAPARHGFLWIPFISLPSRFDGFRALSAIGHAISGLIKYVSVRVRVC